MSSECVLVTGGYGCIGSETAKWLVRHSDATVVIASRAIDQQRNERVFHDVDQERMRFAEVDVRDADRLREVMVEHHVNRVVHLAALQTPDCNAHRDLGLQINLAGTQNVIEAMKSSGLRIARFVFASSIAVYGPRSLYPPGRVPMLAAPHPVNVYGAWKLAGEQISEFFSQDSGVPTISLRPGVLFGPGRDAGLTSTPTTAMKCAALGLPYQIPFRNRQDYLYAPDVGAAFGIAAMDSFRGYGVFTLPSATVETEAIVQAMKDACKELAIDPPPAITVGDEEVPFICDLDYEPFVEFFPRSTHTPFAEAVKQSLAVFRDQVQRGWLVPADVDHEPGG